jgi:hypothetical protein
MYDIPKDLLDALRAAPEIYDALLRGVTEEQARAARGRDENWSVVEVVCHLRDAEERALERMRAIRDADDPFLPGYDQEAWARERRYAEQNLRDAFDAWKGFRSQFTNDLAALTPEGWERTGQHEEQGQITITAHALHMASHDAIHAAQIARQLAANDG